MRKFNLSGRSHLRLKIFFFFLNYSNAYTIVSILMTPISFLYDVSWLRYYTRFTLWDSRSDGTKIKVQEHFLFTAAWFTFQYVELWGTAKTCRLSRSILKKNKPKKINKNFVELLFTISSISFSIPSKYLCT